MTEKTNYINVKKELTNLLIESSMDQYIGMDASVVAGELIQHMDTLKHQQKLTNSTRDSWYWTNGENNG
jgi:hypothetical protein